MIYLMHLMVILTVSASLEHNAYFPAWKEKYNGMGKALEEVCPKVDICNTNTSDSTLQPNGLINEQGTLVSCCEGCSCHRSCYDNLNCCFPDDDASVIVQDSITECMPVKIGNFDKTKWPLIPAYRIVSSSPKRGCKENMTRQAGSNQRQSASCGPQAVAPWGNLYPVYSGKENKIYKNELCARCHGVDDAIRWQLYLACDAFDGYRTIPLSEHLEILQKGIEKSNCSVTFYYPDMSALMGKRCYKETISTCGLQSESETVALQKFTNFTTAKIFQACQSGLNSPVGIRDVVYRNIFCAMCNKAPIKRRPLCETDGSSLKVISSELTLLLKPDIFEGYKGGDAISKLHTVPQACFRTELETMISKCRNILCPSGQVRSSDGNCFFPITRWYPESFVLILKLVYSNSRNVLSMLKDNVIDRRSIIESWRISSPWPSHWAIGAVYHASDISDMEIDSQICISLTTVTNDPKLLYGDIDASLALSWTVNLNGSTFEFQQSFLEFAKFKTISVQQGIIIPAWKSTVMSLGLQTNFTNAPASNWTKMYSRITSTKNRYRQSLTKTFHCRQISLNDDEYTLLVDNQILISNMTKRALFEAEFDLVEDWLGTQTARVCLSDTHFQIEERTNGSSSCDNLVHLCSYWFFIVFWCFIIAN